MKKTTAIMLILAAALVCHADTKTTWRDAQGRVQGTMTTDRYASSKPTPSVEHPESLPPGRILTVLTLPIRAASGAISSR